MNKPLVGHDILILGFHLFPQDKILRFKKDMRVGFYELSQKPEYEKFFEEYSFDVDGILPASREIEEAWDDSLGVLVDTFDGESNTAFFRGRVMGTLYQVRLKDFSPSEVELAQRFSMELQQILL